MAEVLCPQHHWTGANGERYCAGAVDDGHLLNYYRLNQERFEERGGRLTPEARLMILRALNKVHDEIQRRGLVPLPLRDAIARQVAEERRQRAAQQIETVPAPPRAPAKPQPHPPAGIPVASMPTGRKIVVRKKPN